MSKFQNNSQLDTYDAEIIEDIPEQFDPNRYKKQIKNSSSSFNQTAYQVNHPQYSNHPHQQHQTAQAQQKSTNAYPTNSRQNYDSNYKLAGNQMVNSGYGNAYQTLPPKNSMQPMMNQQTHYYASKYGQQNLNSPYGNNKYLMSVQNNQQQNTSIHQQPNYIKEGYASAPFQNPSPTNGIYPKLSPQHESKSHQQQQQQQNFCTFDQRPANFDPKYHRPAPSVPSTRAQSETRKKYTFEDEENDSPFSKKKEYFLRGGDDVPENKKWLVNKKTLDENTKFNGSLSKSETDLLESSQSDTKVSNVKPAIKKHGVTFDEKLEVHEVKNPHYGLEIKSEKRELKKKKKANRKEEDHIIKVRLDMKAKIQNHNMILYNYYEKSLIFNALVFYEENYYRNSILKLQEKLRTNTKTDEKLKEQLLQIIQKENQNTVDIIKYVKKDFHNKLEPFCRQFQTTPEKLHTFPGMYQMIQNIANSVNYNEIISHYAGKDGNNSPSTLKKILGHEARFERFLNNFQTPIKPVTQRKADLWLPKNVVAAIDLHVKEVGNISCKTLTEVVYKLNEVCENDLHRARAIYKYILITQLDALRRNETGALLMHNYDAAFESTNTIFARLCSIAGIENHCIRGLWKTICAEPGEKVEAKCVWNVLNLEGSWRFVQPSFTPMKYYSRQELKYEETEYYFLSDSDTLFNEFLPQEKIWHFSETALSVKEFEKRPILTPHFRMLNLSIIPLTTNLTPNLDREPFKLTLRYPKELETMINFKYTLRPINMHLNYNISNALAERDITHVEHLNYYAISELISKENAIIFKISSLPQIGSYNFTVYAGLTDEILSSEPLPSTTSLLRSLNTDLKAVSSIRINCSKVNYFETPPNHINEITVFGMNNIMSQLGLSCHDYKQGILGTDRDGKVNLVFEMSQPLDIEAYLYSSDVSISSKYLELCILKRVVHNFLILVIQPPHSGLYGLDLHGAPKGSFSPILHTQLPPIGKYLIKSHHQLRTFSQFPKGDNREWGPKQKFYDLGLHAISYNDPYILNDDGKQIEIEIGMLKGVTMWYKLYHDYNGTPREVSNYCFMNYKNSNKREKTVSFLLRFPFRGFYHLALMATDVYPSKPDEIVYNYLIRVQDPSHDVESFPVVVNPILWKNCCLVAPKNYRLNNYDVHFSIIVPNTNEVVVSANDRVVEKLEAREIENSWVGLVSLNEHLNSRFIYIEAEFEQKYKKLLKFKGFRDTSVTSENYFD